MPEYVPTHFTASGDLTAYESAIIQAPEGISTYEPGGLKTATVIKWKSRGHVIYSTDAIAQSLALRTLDHWKRLEP